jgi:acyl-CoA dehydrogenase
VDSDLFDEDHEAFRVTVREFVKRQVEPNLARWDAERLIDRQVWLAAGKQGLLGLAVPAEYGGPGETDYRFRVILQLEIARVGAAALQSGFSTNDDIVLSYLLRHATGEQKARWLPRFVTGETIGAIAMTEPDAGSDLRGIATTAVQDGDGWVIRGSKTFITSGILADLVIVFARTGDRGFSLFVVEDGTPGFSRGRKLDKMGLHAQDTAELNFDDARRRCWTGPWPMSGSARRSASGWPTSRRSRSSWPSCARRSRSHVRTSTAVSASGTPAR